MSARVLAVLRSEGRRPTARRFLKELLEGVP
jgi:hypothetical protein